MIMLSPTFRWVLLSANNGGLMNMQAHWMAGLCSNLFLHFQEQAGSVLIGSLVVAPVWAWPGY